MAGLIISASEIRALSVSDLDGVGSDVAAFSPPSNLPFLEGAPSPLVLVAVGSLIIGITLARRLRKGAAQA